MGHNRPSKVKKYLSPSKIKEAEHRVKVGQVVAEGEEIVSRSRMGDRWKTCHHPAWNFNAVYYEIAVDVES